MSTFWAKTRKTLIGDRAFYALVLSIIIPVVIQNGVSNFVSVLDNLMVGALGDNEMSGVAVSSQLIFVFTLAVFGGMGGPGIYAAQYYGAGNIQGVRESFRIKIMVAVVLSVIGIGILILWQDDLIRLYLQGESEGATANPEEVLRCAKDYLYVMLFGLPPFALASAYSSIMRETDDTLWPMIASLSAVMVNLLGNWLLIYGKLGFPCMGVTGAALATVISRYVELAVMMLRCHLNPQRYVFIRGAYKSMRVSSSLLKGVIRKGLPLTLNEIIWSIGTTLLNVAYSLCGIMVVGAISITSTVNNLFLVVSFSVGTAVAVIVGHDLGAGQFEKARSHVWKLLAFGELLGVLSAGLLLLLSGPVCGLYTGVSQEVRELAQQLLRISAITCVLRSFNHICYFTIRSGGRTVITFLYDCGFTAFFAAPVAFFLIQGLGMDIIPAYTTVALLDLLKCILGFVLVKKGVWLRNITELLPKRENTQL